MLEVGPGVGIYSLPIGTALGPAGRRDVQADMLGALGRRARREGVTNVVPTEGMRSACPIRMAASTRRT